MPGSKLGRTVSGLLKTVEWFFYFYLLDRHTKFLIWLNFKQPSPPLRVFYKFPYPRFLRIAILHGIATMLTLAMLPPYPETPPIAIPIVWGASLGTAITIYSITPQFRNL